MKLIYVETKRKREMQAFFCGECNWLCTPVSFWSIHSSLWLHTNGSGHKKIRMLKLDEVEESTLVVAGKAYGNADLLTLAQGKDQIPDVTIYESRGEQSDAKIKVEAKSEFHREDFYHSKNRVI